MDIISDGKYPANKLSNFAANGFVLDDVQCYRLYTKVYNQGSSFVSDLYVTGGKKMIHAIGKSDPAETILAEKEFCNRLEKLRSFLIDMFYGAE